MRCLFKGTATALWRQHTQGMQPDQQPCMHSHPMKHTMTRVTSTVTDVEILHSKSNLLHPPMRFDSGTLASPSAITKLRVGMAVCADVILCRTVTMSARWSI
jgi:hypothetical protein